MSTTSQIQEIYIGLLGRAADAEGLAYWKAEIDGGVLTIEQLRANIVNEQSEYAEGLGTLTRAQLVNTLYNNLFNRDADTDGLEYWVNGDGSSVNADQLVLALSDGAAVADRLVLDNRTTAATYYTDNATVYSASDAASVISGVGSSSATLDAAKQSVDSGTVGSNAGTAFTLTTDVDSVSGSSLDDVISGVIGSSGTFAAGDQITGGSGSDTINLIDNDATAAGLVTIAGVETINVRLLSGAGQTELNAIAWDGVEVVTNASSLANSTLDVSGLQDDTVIKLYGNTDMNIEFENTSTGATANAVLINAGSAGTATTIGSASATNTANLDLDGNNDGFVTHVNLEVQGSLNLARLEAGSNVDSLTITGTGQAALVTDDTLTTVNASAALGNVDITLEGISDVTVTGGAGDDTIRMGTTLSNNDSFDGGAGDDLLTIGIGGFNRDLNVSNIETVEISYADTNGGTVDMTGASVGTINLVASSAGADAYVTSIADNSVINLGASADNIADFKLVAVSGSENMTINIGTASGSQSYTEGVVSGVEAITVNFVENSTGTHTLTSANFGAQASAVHLVAAGGDADVDIADLVVGGASTLTVTSNGSASIDMETGISGTSLSTIVFEANSTAADIVFDEIADSTGLTSITFDANGGADILKSGSVWASGIELGHGASAGVLDVTVNLNAESNSNIGTAAAAASGIDFATTSSVNLTLNVDVTNASGGGVHVGQIDIVGGTASGDAATLTYNVGTVGNSATFRSEIVNVDEFTGTQVITDSVTLNQESEYVLASGGIDATNVTDVDVQDINITTLATANAVVGAITTSAGAVGQITFVGEDAASATFGAIAASGVGAISLTVGSGGSANFGTIDATGGAIGGIEISGEDGGGVTFGVMSASAVGSISIAGTGDATFGIINATDAGSIESTQTVSGQFTIDLTGVTNAVEIDLGAATNNVYGGQGNDVITLTAGTTGNDTINYRAAAEGMDQIINFGAGSTGSDVIGINVSAISVIASGGSAVATAGLTVLLTSAGSANGAITIANSGGHVTHVVVLAATAFSSTANMASAIGTGGSLEFNVGTGESTAGNVIVAWTDGTDTYVSLATAVAGISGTEAAVSGAATQALAVLDGVTPGQLVAANFDFIA